MTIAGDRFQLTTTRPPAGAESGADDLLVDELTPAQLESALSELESMTRRTYGQFCVVGRALEILGERWALMIVRNLLVAPKSEAELRVGLPRIPAEALGARLRELERTAIVWSVPGPDNELVYQLTEYGQELDEIIVRLGRWGARSLGTARPDEVITTESLVSALRVAFQPDAAEGIAMRIDIQVGTEVVQVRVSGAMLHISVDSRSKGADLMLEPVLPVMHLLSGEFDPAEAVATGSVRVGGDPALLVSFTRIFRLPG
ncbi:helix-turn-helix domain-containing protein [Actinophytocola sp.]|uniref:winged helix-turn-helix transcriptional regulator n=1 Tax=Actinophytocola sp. TaxID=1872138 RepID=UPI002D80220A|nr:helix-turn-helix domain-containing protein [Actinophytocola sp.]HET9141401.1 helix-turn-helix domain-containing protein [Actinophytocola sp.]